MKKTEKEKYEERRNAAPKKKPERWDPPYPDYHSRLQENRRRGRPDDFGEQGIGIGGMKGDD